MRSREAARLKAVPLRLVLRAVRAGSIRSTGKDARGRLLLDEGDVAAWKPRRGGTALAALIAGWWQESGGGPDPSPAVHRASRLPDLDSSQGTTD